jgi:hypothetical protein
MPLDWDKRGCESTLRRLCHSLHKGEGKAVGTETSTLALIQRHTRFIRKHALVQV